MKPTEKELYIAAKELVVSQNMCFRPWWASYLSCALVLTERYGRLQLITVDNHFTVKYLFWYVRCGVCSYAEFHARTLLAFYTCVQH